MHLWCIFDLYQGGQQTKNDKSLHIKTLHFHWVGKRKGKYVQIEVPDGEFGGGGSVLVGGGPVGEEGRPVQLLLWPVG